MEMQIVSLNFLTIKYMIKSLKKYSLFLKENSGTDDKGEGESN
jgi:hypothetical protein